MAPSRSVTLHPRCAASGLPGERGLRPSDERMSKRILSGGSAIIEPMRAARASHGVFGMIKGRSGKNGLCKLEACSFDSRTVRAGRVLVVLAAVVALIFTASIV